MWKELFRIAPELIPIIIQTVMDLEQVVTGIKRGEIRKSRVMNIISNILDTKDYFLKQDSDGQMEILNLVSMFVDVIVSTFNYTGLFASSEKLDFTPIPVEQGASNEGN
ncbi:MAG: hypothetical protein DHS20C13_02910 [Thermodesulfobacteriota bacterium]|nr:MAG: hypothetical protein DHS20C13_02910 [Thermodesulfobacteriota bacterium]